VQVVEKKRNRILAGQRQQKLMEAFPQARLVGRRRWMLLRLRRGQLGQQANNLGSPDGGESETGPPAGPVRARPPATQGFDNRLVGQGLFKFARRAGQTQRVGGAEEKFGEAGLADARLALDHGQLVR